MFSRQQPKIPCIFYPITSIGKSPWVKSNSANTSNGPINHHVIYLINDFTLFLYFSISCNFYSSLFTPLCWKTWDFPDSSVGKESACNAGDPGWIPGPGRSNGEGIGYSHQYSWASLEAQLVKNLLAMWKTWVRSLGSEDLLEKRKVTHSCILA